MGSPIKTESASLDATLTHLFSANGEYGRKLANFSRRDLVTEPMPDVSHPAFVNNYALWQVARKIPFDIGIDRAQVCLDKYLECEEKCAATNARPLYYGRFKGVISYARRIIFEVLGEFCAEEWLDSASYSGGASTQRKRVESYIQNKYSDVDHCTSSIAPFVKNVFGCFRIAESANYSSVPKDAKTERPIEIQPQGNMFFQKGIGLMVRKRLLKHGIDLNDQTPNQNWALIASKTDAYATVDLSSASDLIAWSVVELLLSWTPDWLHAIELARVDTVNINGELTKLNKFAGMGNGFTFEIESLIFYALIRAVSECSDVHAQHVHLVYGDDIIISSHIYSEVVELFDHLGFEVNLVKSYAKGPFRESCGKHYHKGMEIPTFNIKFTQINDVGDVYYLINQLSRTALRAGKALRYLRKFEKGHRVPANFSMRSGIICSFDEATPSAKRRGMNFYGWKVRYYTERNYKAEVSQEGALAMWLHTGRNGEVRTTPSYAYANLLKADIPVSWFIEKSQVVETLELSHVIDTRKRCHTKMTLVHEWVDP